MKRIANMTFMQIILVWVASAPALATSARDTRPASRNEESAMNYGPVGVDGAVKIMDIRLEEAGDSLFLAFQVDVRARAINNRQQWRIVPQLSVPDTETSLAFPTILITGRQKDRHLRRKVRFGNIWLTANYPEYLASIPKNTDTVLTYMIKVPYEFWMDKAHLQIHQYLASPKEKRQLFSSDGYGMVRLEPREPYLVQPHVNYLTPAKEIKRRSAGYSSLVDFPVGVSRILPDYRRNPEELSAIDKHVTLIKESPYIEIEGIYMEGYASPEGSRGLNERLSRERVEALKKYFVITHGIDAGIIEVKSMIEDWEGFRSVVDGWQDGEDRRKILEVIDSPADTDTKEKRLRALPQWRLVVQRVFPLLRRTEYRVDFLVKDFSVEESRSLIETNPELFSHYELFMLAMSYAENPWKRLEVLELFLRFYPDDQIALNNYTAALIQAGELPTARRFAERIAETSLAANNIGVLHLMDGQYESAERFFRSASVPEAAQNMEELRKKVENDEQMERFEDR